MKRLARRPVDTVFPANTPRAIVEHMHKEIVAVLNRREVQTQMESVGIDPKPSDPAAFHALVKSEHARWDKVVRAAGLRQQ